MLNHVSFYLNFDRQKRSSSLFLYKIIFFYGHGYQYNLMAFSDLNYTCRCKGMIEKERL